MRKLPFLSTLLLAGMASAAEAAIPIENIGPIGVTPDEIIRLTAQAYRSDPGGPAPACNVKLFLGIPGSTPLGKGGSLLPNGPALSLDMDPAKLGLPLLPSAPPVGNVPRWYVSGSVQRFPNDVSPGGSTIADKLCADAVNARVEVIDRVTGATRQTIDGN